MPDGNAPVRIDVVSDFVCPWCWIGKRSIDTLAARRPVQRAWHPYFLHPGLPKEGMDRRALMRMKFGSDGPSPATRDALTFALEDAGLSIDFTAIERVPNTLNAHRLMLWAEGQGVADLVAESLFHAYFTDTLDIADPGVLTRIGAAAGLDPDILADLLAGDRDRDVVEARAADMLDRGIPGVPAQMIGRRSLMVGAQSPAALEDAIVSAAS